MVKIHLGVEKIKTDHGHVTIMYCHVTIMSDMRQHIQLQNVLLTSDSPCTWFGILELDRPDLNCVPVVLCCIINTTAHSKYTI